MHRLRRIEHVEFPPEVAQELKNLESLGFRSSFVGYESTHGGQKICGFNTEEFSVRPVDIYRPEIRGRFFINFWPVWLVPFWKPRAISVSISWVFCESLANDSEITPMLRKWQIISPQSLSTLKVGITDLTAVGAGPLVTQLSLFQ